MQIWVADTGVGKAESAGMGTWLTNSQARLQSLFGVKARLELSEQTPHGLRVDLRLTVSA